MKAPKQQNEIDLLQAARCEDLQYNQIKELSVLGEFETRVISTLKSSGAHLLQGARGVGKSMLLRSAEIEMDSEFGSSRQLAVYVNFKTSTLLEGVKAGERSAFQIWVNLKILQSIHAKLERLDLIGAAGGRDPYFRLFGIDSVGGTTHLIEEKIHLLQKLAFSSSKQEILAQLGSDFLDRLLDTGFLTDVLRGIVKQFSLARLVLLFDEAAHTFIPTQQEVFFEIFKLLHGGAIAVKAAVYPTVTSYGRNFEVGQDAIVISMDRFEPGQAGRAANRALFRDLIDRRLPHSSAVRKKVFARGALLDLLIDLSTGNPRGFLHLLNRALAQGWNDRAVQLATQEFVDQELIPYHRGLSKRLPKYAAHVAVGLDLLRDYLIPEVRVKNSRETKSGYQAAFFTITRRMSPNLKLGLDILTYSGILVNKGTVKIADRQTGLRYMVHISLLATEKAFSSTRLADAISSISLTDYREFSDSDPNIEKYTTRLVSSNDQCSHCSHTLSPNDKFCPECGTRVEATGIISSLLEENIDGLSLSSKLKNRVRPVFPRVGDVVQASREEVMKIKFIKEVRSRIIKNAADEFISG